MEPERARQFRDLVVVGRDRAAVAERPQVLRRIERERGEVAERAGAAAVEAGARGLSGVLEHRNAELAKRRHRRGTAEQVDRDHALVRGVSAARTVSAVTLRVAGSTSQNTGRAPALTIASADA